MISFLWFHFVTSCHSQQLRAFFRRLAPFFVNHFQEKSILFADGIPLTLGLWFSYLNNRMRFCFGKKVLFVLHRIGAMKWDFCKTAGSVSNSMNNFIWIFFYFLFIELSLHFAVVRIRSAPFPFISARHRCVTRPIQSHNKIQWNHCFQRVDHFWWLLIKFNFRLCCCHRKMNCELNIFATRRVNEEYPVILKLCILQIPFDWDWNKFPIEPSKFMK